MNIENSFFHPPTRHNAMYKRLAITTNSSAFNVRRLAVELSHLIGFCSVAMQFPLFLNEPPVNQDTLCFVLTESAAEGWKVEKKGNRVHVDISPDNEAMSEVYTHIYKNFSALTDGFQQGIHRTERSDFVSATEAAHALEPFDNRKVKGLESLFDKDYILLDRNHDLLPDLVDARILLPISLNAEQTAAACNIAARLGLETTAITFPLTDLTDNGGNMFVFCEGEVSSLSLDDEDGRKIFRISGSGKNLIAFSSALCGSFPEQKTGILWTDILRDISESLIMQNIDGQLAWLEAYKQRITKNTVCYFSPKISDISEKIKSDYSPAKFAGHKDLRKIHETVFEVDWEVERCKALLDTHFWPNVKQGDVVEVHALLSEDKEVRTQIAKEIGEKAAVLGSKTAAIEIICAYKQGFSWLEEVVTPQLLQLPEIDAIDIAFRPFLPDGVTSIRDNDYGATPSYNNIDMNDEDKWYDLPIRYLQELYPIDDIISGKLSIDRDKIRFGVYDGEEDITYQITATYNGNEVYRSRFKTACHERSYLDTYPQLGKVHPSTGWLIATINGKVVIDERIRTDTEAVWDIYQSEILPLCRDYCAGKYDSRPAQVNQPFFAQLRLDIGLSEPDERLDCREDHISSLDALHEDIYFAGLDFFKTYGMAVAGEMFDAPGLILPVIRKTSGRPYLKFTLFDHQKKTPCIDFDSTIFESTLSPEDISLRINNLLWTGSGFKVSVAVEAEIEPEILSAYVRLLDSAKLSISEKFKGVEIVEFQLYGKNETSRFIASITEEAEPLKDLSIGDIDISERELIGYERYLEIISQLKRVPGVAVYKTAESYLGRDIYAIELLSDYLGYVSRVKRINRDPSEIINSRHHANEVSSTNSAFMLLRELLTRDKYRGLGNEMLLCICPFENPDGAAIHYELQQDNPYWKLHIARFNAIGKEFYHEHFKEHTIHTEAHGFTRLWRRLLPDIVVDNHGVPSHEWEQPFSGYTSPSYKGFWLPRSLIYGYFWSIGNGEYSANKLVNKRIEEVVSDIFASDNEIEDWNREWQERFAKYAHDWMPQLFPAEYYNNMINYWIYFDYDAAHRYPSIRFPWITAVAYTSEVADETAQGGYLHLCARAHMLHDLAIIDMIRDSKSVFKEEVSSSRQETAISCQRQRPIVLD